MAASQTVPIVVPFPQSAPPQQISQVELALLLSLRGRLAHLESEVGKAEESIKARLQAGAPVESGDHIAQLKTASRRNVSWKEVAVRLADRLKLDGEKYCARILAATKPSQSISLQIN